MKGEDDCRTHGRGQLPHPRLSREETILAPTEGTIADIWQKTFATTEAGKKTIAAATDRSTVTLMRREKTVSTPTVKGTMAAPMEGAD